jgi:hypothetical protein
MIRSWSLAILSGLALASTAAAQTKTWQFHWQPGQVLTYRVEHSTSVTEVAGGNKVETTAKHNLVKRWQVLAVDPQGVATLQMSLTSLRHEQTRAGATLLFDSENPDKSTPELRQQLQKYVGQPLAVLRVNASGQVVEVKENKFGSASRYESDPPFVVVLPGQAPSVGQAWQRDYQITLEPPHGTGEKYKASQKYTFKGAAKDQATVTLMTQVTLPQSVADCLPLLQMQPEGEAVFDLASGRLLRAQLQIDQTLQKHQGEGSSYRFQSAYTEELVQK